MYSAIETVGSCANSTGLSLAAMATSFFGLSSIMMSITLTKAQTSECNLSVEINTSKAAKTIVECDSRNSE
jgi:hypothetical protein